MMKKRFKKTIIALIVIVAMISVTACSRNKNNANNNTAEDGSNTGDNTPADDATDNNVGNQTANGGIVDQYNTLLQTETNRDNVYGFIDKNITNASESEADQLIAGVLGYEDTYENVDYSRLYAYKNYVSDEVEDFLELMYENQEKPYMTGTNINVTLDELLDRAEDFEKHITEFPDGITTQPSYEMYVKLMNAAITGGYDKANNVANFYHGDAENRIDGRAVDEYMKFLADEVEDGNNDQVNANTVTNNSANNTANNTTANGTTNNNSVANNNTVGNNTTSANNTTNNGTANNSAANNSAANNNTTTNNTTNNNVTSNTNVNVGDNSEDNFTAPITRSIVRAYVDLLVKTNNEITTEVEDFYANLNTLIAEKFDI